MGLQPTASRTELLLACPRPFDPNLETGPDEPGEPARYGSAFHQVLAACLKTKKPLEQTPAYAREVDAAARRYDVEHARDELAGHVKSSIKTLRNWLAREKLEVVEVERAHAILPHKLGSWHARNLAPHDEAHRYELRRGEVGGTVDLVAATGGHRVVVVDHKTGAGDADGFARPASIPQMRTLGLAASAATVEVGIFHADRRGLPIVYAEPYEKPDREAHAIELHAALTRVGHGFLRPGPHCPRCPARITCPAHAADLLSESTAALVEGAAKLAAEPISGPLVPAPANALSVEERAGILYEVLRRFRKLDEAGTAEIKRLVKSGAIVETKSGKTLTIRTQSYETLSKKSVVEALGKIAGERELERLRKKGAMRETTRETLVEDKA